MIYTKNRNQKIHTLKNLQPFWSHRSHKMMFGIQESALHPVRGPVTTLKEEPLGAAAAAHNLHQAARSWMQPAIGMEPHGGG